MELVATLSLWIGATVTAAVVVAAVRRVSMRMGVVDLPNERSLHVRPTPRGGGLGVILTIALALFAAHVIVPGWFTAPWPALAAGAVVIALVSAIDDVRPLPAAARLFVHLGVSAWAVASIGVRAPTDLGLGAAEGFLVQAIAIVWVAGLINAYNFMDGIDGIAGLQAVVAGTGWAIVGTVLGQQAVAIIGAATAAAALGFLVHNWSPARIFMGDIGSAFLGYTFAVLPLVAGAEQPWAYVVGVLLVWPFVFDAIYTLIRRLLRGENLLRPHRSHLYQRLVTSGHGHAAVTSLYGALALLGAGVAIGLVLAGVTAAPATILIAVTAVALHHLVRRQERASTRRTQGGAI